MVDENRSVSLSREEYETVHSSLADRPLIPGKVYGVVTGRKSNFHLASKARFIGSVAGFAYYAGVSRGKGRFLRVKKEGDVERVAEFHASGSLELKGVIHPVISPTGAFVGTPGVGTDHTLELLRRKPGVLEKISFE